MKGCALRVMSVERKMTIARGLARLKTINAQLADISKDIAKYGAWNDKNRHPLGDTKVDLSKNHKQAMEKINSLYQQFNDLTKEFVKIKTAINKTNYLTVVNIDGNNMTINEALIYKNYIQDHVQKFVNGYNYSVNNAQSNVDRFNRNISVNDLSEKEKKIILADILYLVTPDKIKEMNTFSVEFINNVDGELNAINAVTEIIFN